MKTCLVLIALIGAAAACNFPPRLWCSSPEIAVQCNVYDQCQKTVWSKNADAAPVNLELYFESQCPACMYFITKELVPTYKVLSDVMNVTMFPYGNAQETKEGGKWKFQCQHGEDECRGNLYETCAIHYLKTFPKYLPFIACLEIDGSMTKEAVKSCAKKTEAPADAILSCANSTLGNELEHEMAVKTDALKPPHEFVPWIVLNGDSKKPLQQEAREDLKKVICKLYTGPKPAACTQLQYDKFPLCMKRRL